MGWARYLTPSAAHRRLGLVCLGAGAQEGALAECGPRTLSCFAAVLVARGAGQLRLRGGANLEVVAPALFWLRPGQQHRYGPGAGGWAESWVLFEGPAADAYAELGYLDHGVVPLADVTGVRRSLVRVAAACRAEAPRHVEAAVGVHDLIVTAHRSRADRDPAGGALLAALARDAHLPLSVPEHARRLAMTPARLRDTVRRAAGCGPKEFLLQARLTRAKQLLVDTDLTVAAIGRAVGYQDPGFFTRLFTRRVGVSPMRFRADQIRAHLD